MYNSIFNALILDVNLMVVSVSVVKTLNGVTRYSSNSYLLVYAK